MSITKIINKQNDSIKFELTHDEEIKKIINELKRNKRNKETLAAALARIKMEY